MGSLKGPLSLCRKGPRDPFVDALEAASCLAGGRACWGVRCMVASVQGYEMAAACMDTGNVAIGGADCVSSCDLLQPLAAAVVIVRPRPE
eukprot:144136-Chlamydomonas_euryale.AAC.1